MSSDRTRTQPEPLLERAVERIRTERQAKDLDKPVVDFSIELDESPLSLAESHRSSQLSAARAAPTDLETLTKKSSISSILREVRDLYAVGDFSGALASAERVLIDYPKDEAAQRYAERCRETLTQMYAARLGSLDQIPRVAIPSDQITWLSLDHRAGFLLSLIDGASPLEIILDISGMSRLDALRILATLLQQNIITMK